jgi:hypothetical protein
VLPPFPAVVPPFPAVVPPFPAVVPPFPAVVPPLAADPPEPPPPPTPLSISPPVPAVSSSSSPQPTTAVLSTKLAPNAIQVLRILLPSVISSSIVAAPTSCLGAKLKITAFEFRSCNDNRKTKAALLLFNNIQKNKIFLIGLKVLCYPIIGYF